MMRMNEEEYNNATDEYTTIQELTNKVTEYRQNTKTYKNKQPLNTKDDVFNLINAILHEALELHETTLFQDEELFDLNLDENKHYDNIKKELADVMIYCIALADYLEEPVFSLITNKINYNIRRNRQYGVSEHVDKIEKRCTDCDWIDSEWKDYYDGDNWEEIKVYTCKMNNERLDCEDLDATYCNSYHNSFEDNEED